MKKEFSVFEIVANVIGEENAVKLQEKCAGMVFYIPVRLRENAVTLEQYNHLRSVGNSHKIAIMNLAQKSERSYKTIDAKIKRLLRCQN